MRGFSNVCMNKLEGSVLIDVYGYVVEIQSAHRAALDGLAEDFAFFRSQKGTSRIVIELLDEDPPYHDLPTLTATVYTPRNVAYRDGDRTYLDYSGRALAIHNAKAGEFRVYTRNSDLAYEIAYLFLLSQCGEWFDARELAPRPRAGGQRRRLRGTGPAADGRRKEQARRESVAIAGD